MRTPSDHSSVDSSPRLIAASHVLHRLLMPRHPPTALNNLTTTNTTQHHHTPRQNAVTRQVIKMLASTIQFSNTTPHPPTRNPPHPVPHPTPKGPAVLAVRTITSGDSASSSTILRATTPHHERVSQAALPPPTTNERMLVGCWFAP